ncbi:MAG: hypothetical protein DWQ02_16765, partial [Bacteroidetes bacterium]
PIVGARPMKRVLQKDVINELSKVMLSGEFVSGDTIYIDTDKNGLVFGKEPCKGAEKPKADPAPKKKAPAKKEKDLEALKKATKDVEDAVKDIEE